MVRSFPRLPIRIAENRLFNIFAEDLDGDGIEEMIVVSNTWVAQDQSPQPFRIFAQDGAGGFRDVTATFMDNVPLLTCVADVIVQDFNGDGRMDILFVDIGFDAPPFPRYKNTLLLSNVSGKLVPQSIFDGMADFSHDGDAADINGDGVADMFVLNMLEPSYFVTIGPRGPEIRYLDFDTGAAQYISSELADINGDGRPDLVLMPGAVPNTPGVILYNTNGTFSRNNMATFDVGVFDAVRYPGVTTQAETPHIVSADIDGDGDLDIVTVQFANPKGGKFTVYRNDNGKLVRSTEIKSPDGTGYAWLDAVDFNGDGHMDFFASLLSDRWQNNTDQPFLFINDGTGRFTSYSLDSLGLGSEFQGHLALIKRGGGQTPMILSNNYYTVLPFVFDVFSTGPGRSDPAVRGAAGFNEAFYLNSNPDVAAAVREGRYADGLAHYLAVGRAEGRAAMAPGTKVSGSANGDLIILTTGNEQVDAGGGDDTITGGLGNDTIDGGAGFDTVRIGTTFAQSTMTRNGNRITVAGADGTDILVNVERIQFTDRSILLNSEQGMNFVAAPVVPVAITSNAYPTQSALGDFNGDGNLDIVLTRLRFPISPESASILFLFGNGSGGFTLGSNGATTSGAATVHPREVIVGDFNGDGRTDIFVADHGYDANPFPGRQNTLLLSSGTTDMVDATFRLPQQSDFTHSASFADIDGDGDMDIVSGNVWGQNLLPPAILVNDGQGNFTIKQDAIPANLSDVRNHRFLSQEFVDIDSDGDPDLVLLGDQMTVDYVLYNDGTGVFVNVRQLPTKAYGGAGVGHDVDAIDINGDGRMDLIASFINITPDSRGGMAAIYVQQADGSFVDETATRHPQLNPNRTSDWLHFVELADLDGDGDLDAIAMYNNNPSGGTAGPIEIWTNNNGVFSIAVAPGSQPNFNFARIGDVNNDGVPDIVTVSGGLGVQALINQATNLAIAGTAGNDVLSGNGFGNTISAGSGNDRIDGGLGDDTLNGEAGDDVLIGGAGNDRLNGGTGYDTAIFTGRRSSYTITVSGDTTIVNGPQGRDILTGVERLVFDDRAVTIGQPTWQSRSSTLSANSGGATLMITQVNATVTNDPVRGILSTRVQINGQDVRGVPPTLKRGWRVAAMADIDGNGKQEIFFFGVEQVAGVGSGFGATWELGADGVVERPQIQFQMRIQGWEVAGAANVNGIAGDEIIWQNTLTGAKAIWTDANRDGVVDGGFVIAGLGTNTAERIVGVADLDKDGLREFLVFNDATGALKVFEATGTVTGDVTVVMQQEFASFTAFEAAVAAAGASRTIFGLMAP